VRALRIAALTIGTFAVLVALAMSVGWWLTEPEPLPANSVSETRLQPGPYRVEVREFTWVDASRSTPANGAYQGAPDRTLAVSMWFPADLDVAHPLLVFSHGLMSSRAGCTYMAEHLASYGYVVVSADHPLSNLRAPGGPDYHDVVNQPGDVSYLITHLLALEPSQRPFAGAIDRNRIGVFGISLGAATVTLTALHPAWRDPRIAAAVSIAGPGDVFGAHFFDHAPVPFLMIAGTTDAIVDYRLNAVPIPLRIRDGGLLTISGATHAGFTNVTSGLLRLLGNPDDIGCNAASAADIPERSVFIGLFGTAEQGLLEPSEQRPPCAVRYSDVMRAGRQQMIATLAVRAFFESRFAPAAQARADNREFLESTLARELHEVAYTPATRR